ncbi:probable mediator of RNA polymerase II transcription subunit 26c isoform X1 [Primulina eburnea]|uniref:probable mediator of RNA polymerase II transcription subunit 26c isoform X1 n=1 Tax=Primulina eburnea TaxID=1245227 RepID=UPI003C6CAC8E
MDLDEFRSLVVDSGLDVWTWIDMAISLASADHEKELMNRRDGIIQKLYAPLFSRCQNCDNQFFRGPQCNVTEPVNNETQEEKMESKNEVEEEEDDIQLREILEIKNLLDSSTQSEGSLAALLQRLAAKNITFKELKETDIGRQVTRLRKHSSDEVRRLVKVLVRKWKDTVDEWVRLNVTEEEITQFSDDKKSPPRQAQLKNSIQNAEMVPHEEAQNGSVSYCSTPPYKEKVKDNQIESDKLYASSAKRLHGNQEETRTVRRQRTEQTMNFDSMPKVKKVAIANNGGTSTLPVKYY